MRARKRTEALDGVRAIEAGLLSSPPIPYGHARTSIDIVRAAVAGTSAEASLRELIDSIRGDIYLWSIGELDAAVAFTSIDAALGERAKG